ncbi:MAG: hypothetical protein ABIL18_05055, partial [candidate division WOR-3 bacterium]
LNLGGGCKNPHDYEPKFDSLYPPPAPPQLISPKNDTAIWYGTPFPHNVLLTWSSVNGAEYYQLEIVKDDSSALTGENLIDVDYSSYNFTINRNGYYFWRVRAYSRNWTWYTEWSVVYHFGAFYSP